MTQSAFVRRNRRSWKDNLRITRFPHKSWQGQLYIDYWCTVLYEVLYENREFTTVGCNYRSSAWVDCLGRLLQLCSLPPMTAIEVNILLKLDWHHKNNRRAQAALLFVSSAGFFFFIFSLFSHIFVLLFLQFLYLFHVRNEVVTNVSFRSTHCMLSELMIYGKALLLCSWYISNFPCNVRKNCFHQTRMQRKY